MAEQKTRTAPLLKNIRLVPTSWGFEKHRRVFEDREDASDADAKRSADAGFKQVGAGHGVTIENELGRALTAGEMAQITAEGFVEV